MATSVIKPANAGVDLPISLPTSGWSSNQWTYSNSAITADCAIEVEFKAGTLNTNVPYIEYDKVSGGGGIVFTVPSVPTVAIPVIAHVYYTQAGAFTTTSDTAITTTGVTQSFGANVNEALRSIVNRTAVTVSAGTNVTIRVQNCSVYSQLNLMLINMMLSVGTGGLSSGSTVFTLPSGYVSNGRNDYQIESSAFLYCVSGTNEFKIVSGTLAAGTYDIACTIAVTHT